MGKANTDRDISQHQDADRRVSKDWMPFAHNLAQILSRLEEGQSLILLSKYGNRYRWDGELTLDESTLHWVGKTTRQ